MERAFSILFVCTGNTCRSPLAEVIMRRALDEAGVKNVAVCSAGTAAADGARPSKSARVAAKQMDLSLSGFRSRQLTRRRVLSADLILTMAMTQREEIARRWPEAAEKTFVISEFSRSNRKAIEDPMGQPEEAYLRCASDLSDEAEKLVGRIRRMLKARRQT